MKQDKGIILTFDSKIVDIFKIAGAKINLTFDFNDNLAEYFLKLVSDRYAVTAFDCEQLDPDNLRWIKVIRRIRPKLPLIVMSKELDNKIGWEIHEAGAFFYQQHPIDQKVLGEVLLGALNNFHIQFSSV